MYLGNFYLMISKDISSDLNLKIQKPEGYVSTSYQKTELFSAIISQKKVLLLVGHHLSLIPV